MTAVFGLIDENTPNHLNALDQIWAEGLKNAGDRDFLGYREVVSRNPLKFASVYKWITYKQADIRRQHIGSALHTLFKSGQLVGGDYETVGLWSANRPGACALTFFQCLRNADIDVEWQLVDIACQTYNKVGVSLYDTLGKDSVGMSCASS